LLIQFTAITTASISVHKQSSRGELSFPYISLTFNLVNYAGYTAGTRFTKNILKLIFRFVLR